MSDFNLASFSPQPEKIAVVTGANTGLGYETALELAKLQINVILACRNLTKAEEAKQKIIAEFPEAKLDLLELDLSSLTSVRTFSKNFQQKYSRLDVLVNNAGIMALPEREETAEGFEKQLGVNHLGHFLLTGLLLDTLERTSGARVVSLSSVAHKFGKINFEDLQLKDNYEPWKAYGQSKIACLLFALELNRRLQANQSKVISVAAHPGFSPTDLQRHLSGPFKWLNQVTKFLSQPPSKGALPTLYAALGEDIRGGDYLGPDGFLEGRGQPAKVEPNNDAKDLEIARRLWEESEKLVGFTYQF